MHEHTITLGKHSLELIIDGFISELESRETMHLEIVEVLMNFFTRAELEAMGYADFIGDVLLDDGKAAYMNTLIPLAEGICPVCGEKVEYGCTTMNRGADEDPNGYSRSFVCKCGTSGQYGFNSDGTFNGIRNIWTQGCAATDWENVDEDFVAEKVNRISEEHIITLGKHPVRAIISGYISELENDGTHHDGIAKLLLTAFTRAELTALGFEDYIEPFFNESDAELALIPFAEGVCPVCGKKVEYLGRDVVDTSGYKRWFSCECGTEGMYGFDGTGTFNGIRSIMKQSMEKSPVVPKQRVAIRHHYLGTRTFFNIAVGNETFAASTKMTLENVRLAYAGISDKVINLDALCQEDGECIIDCGTSQLLQVVLGEDGELTKAWYDEETDEYHAPADEVARIIVKLMNHWDKALDVQLV